MHKREAEVRDPLPAPPAGASPTVAFVRAVPATERFGVALIATVSLSAIGAGFHYFRALNWTTTLVIFGGALLLLLQTGLSMTTSAGVDWVRVGDRYVATASLAQVKTFLTVNGMTIDLRDREGRRLRTRLSYLTDSPEVWSLFHAGLLQSIHGGLEADTRTRRVLGLGTARNAG